MIPNKNIVISKIKEIPQRSITINLDDVNLSKLNYILNNIKIEHLPGYWVLQELLKHEKYNKNELIAKKMILNSCTPVLEHIKHQISRFYIFDIIEAKISNDDTEINQVFSNIINIISSGSISKNNVLTADIISKLAISNINTIFNRYSTKKLDSYYQVKIIQSFDSNYKNIDYFDEALEYASNYTIDNLNITIEPNLVKKKIYKI